MRDEDGYTLIELSVALALSGIIIALAYTTLSFAGRLIVRWQDRVDAEDQMHLFVERLSMDVLESTAVAERRNGWVIHYPAGDSVTYSVDRSAVARDSARILSGDSIAVTVGYPEGDSEGDSESTGSDEMIEATVRILVTMTSPRGYRLNRSMRIVPRHPSGWPRAADTGR